MAIAWFRFYAELNDFLPAASQGQPMKRHFDVSGSVKDLIEGFGVPHTEVDLIVINGEPAAFSQPPRKAAGARERALSWERSAISSWAATAKNRDH